MRPFVSMLVLVASATLPAAAEAGSCRASSSDETVALVELYTSQGCSSCPPADRWLAALPAEFGADRAIPLSLHVGYWDAIGWKDPFARPEFSERQRRLAARAVSGRVYTPEVFVGGAELAQWRTDAAFRGAVEAVHVRRAPLRIDVDVRTQPEALEVSARVAELAAGRVEPEVVLVLKQHGHLTDVRAGENRGVQLANDHVVRHWVTAPAGGERSVTIPLPKDGPRRFELVAFAQDRRSGAILQAMALPLERCDGRPGAAVPAEGGNELAARE